MKRFRLTYNGVTSEFNGVECGTSSTISNGVKTSYSIVYSVRPSKTNTMHITKLYECHQEDGSLIWHFNCKNQVRRGLNVIVEII